jgi:hypothetical protein
MNFLKTPQQLLMEEAGMAPASPGLLHTPKQMLMQESGVVPTFASGGGVQQTNNPMFGQNASWLFGVNAATEYPQFVPPPQQQQTQTYANGGIVGMSRNDMLASLAASGQLPEHFDPAGAAYQASSPTGPLTSLVPGMNYSPNNGLK